MNMQKMQVRADLERMIYNYALTGQIENDTADKIVSFIGLTIGGNDLPETQSRIIVFPAPPNTVAPDSVKIPQLLDEKEDDDEQPPYSEWLANFKDTGLGNYGRCSINIFKALYHLGINSLEELAKMPPQRFCDCRIFGLKSYLAIREVLHRHGFITGENWDKAARQIFSEVGEQGIEKALHQGFSHICG